MDLCKLVEQYGDDTNCRKALENYPLAGWHRLPALPVGENLPH